jgi:hypothetical protein
MHQTNKGPNGALVILALIVIYVFLTGRAYEHSVAAGEGKWTGANFS